MKKPVNPPKITDYGGTTKKILRYVDKTDNEWSAFNPSIIFSEKHGYLCLIRCSNYFYNNLGHTKLTTENRVRNKMYLAHLDPDLEVKNLTQVTFLDGPKQKRGVEDGRLYIRGDKTFFHTVMKEEHTKKPRISTYEIDIDTAQARFIHKYESSDYQSVEKNWMTTLKSKNTNFEFIYDVNNTISLDKKLVPNSKQSKKYKNLRGGSNLLELEDGSYLSVSHYTYYKNTWGFSPEIFGYTSGTTRHYTHVFTKYNQLGELTHISDEFVFQDLQVEFAAGIENYGDKFVVSYGVKDLSANLAFIDKSKVFELLTPIQE